MKMVRKQLKKVGIYIDTNVFVAYARKKEVQHKQSKEFIDYIINNINDPSFRLKFDFFTSRFTEAEIASALRRKEKTENKVRGFLHKLNSPNWAKAIIPLPSQSMTIEKFVPEIVEVAIKYGAKFADNVQACCIELHKESIDYIITEDGPLKKTLQKKMKRIKIIGLGDGALSILKKRRIQ